MKHRSSQNDGRIPFEKNLNYFQPMTFILLLIWAGLYFFPTYLGLLDGLLMHFGLLGKKVLEAEVWRLITYMGFHANLDHLLSNGVIFYIVGIACENSMGFIKLLLLVLVSCLGAGLACLVFSVDSLVVGASGVVFGCIGGLVAFLYKNQKHYFVRDKRIGFVFGLWALFAISQGFLSDHISNAAHIGGVVSGIAFGSMGGKS